MFWKFEWITRWQDALSDEFLQKWNDLYAQDSNSHVFFHPSLGKAWLETYLPIRTLNPLFCIAHSEGNTIFLPLIIWKKNWKNAFQRTIIPLGYSDYDYHDPIINGETSNYILNKFYIELLNNIQKVVNFDNIELGGIRSSHNENGWKEEEEYCPYSLLSQYNNPEDFLKSLTISLRGDIRRQLRRLNELGNLKLLKHDKKTLDLAIESCDPFLEHHRQRWPNAYKAPGFHRKLIENGVPAEVVDFSELKLNSETVGWHLGFKDKEHYYYYLPAINQKFSNYSPGKIHLWLLVQDCIENSFRIFDHLRGEENYKSGWSNQIQKLYKFEKTRDYIFSNMRNNIVSIKKRIK